MADVLALIPAYEEGPRVAGVVLGARALLPVLVVDDGSPDDTTAQAESAGATVLAQRPNQGKGAALRAGFRWALARDVDAVVTLDADGQHDPAEIATFLDAFERTEADLIIGRRDFAQMPPVRRLANRLGGLAISWAAGRDIPDNQSGFRLLSRRLIEAVATSDEAGFEYEIEMITTCIRAGFRLEWVPIRTIYAGEPSHIRPWRHFMSFVRMVRATRRAVRTPLA
ncbi:MAG: glycosyltransferase family 2 protein [Chloroflexota bacterium]|nr:glycosyltransferase family 2 protein [Chloroflexota bacterium]